MERFISLKQKIAQLLVPVLLLLAVYTFGYWFLASLSPETLPNYTFRDVNSVFFDEFFTLLIIVDVILLLVSFFHTDQFHKVIRNSGFIISTILLRLSFGVRDLSSVILLISGVVFGLIILKIYQLTETNIESK